VVFIENVSQSQLSPGIYKEPNIGAQHNTIMEQLHHQVALHAILRSNSLAAAKRIASEALLRMTTATKRKLEEEIAGPSQRPRIDGWRRTPLSPITSSSSSSHDTLVAEEEVIVISSDEEDGTLVGEEEVIVISSDEEDVEE